MRRKILSPINAEQAKTLVEDFNCELADSNQAVIDQSNLELLAVRPFQLDDLFASLHFPKDKIVVSAVAGISLSQLKEKADLPEKLGLILPGVAAENSQGFIPIYPDIAEVKTLSNALGKTITFKTESQYEQVATMACLKGGCIVSSTNKLNG